MPVSSLRLHCDWRLCFLTALAVVALSSQARAQQPDPAAEKLVNMRLEWHAQQARQEAAGWEVDLIAPPRGGGAALRNFADPTSVLNELRPVLDEDYKTLRNATLKLSETAKTRRAEA